MLLFLLLFVYVLFNSLVQNQPASSRYADTSGLAGLDTKLISLQRLALAELEVSTSLGLTRLLALDGTAVAREESGVLELLLVLGVDLDERTGDGEAQGLALTGETTTVEVYLNIILTLSLEQLQWLLYYTRRRFQFSKR